MDLKRAVRRLVAPSDGADPDIALLERLRDGDEQAFMELVERHHAALLRLAMRYVADRAVAEEVVQETWVAVLRGIDRFEGRSSLKTWIFSILVNRAKSIGARERRTVPFSSLEQQVGEDEPSVDPARFRPSGDPLAGAWAQPPRSWGALPDQRALEAETRRLVDKAIADLPPSQRMVVSLRDVQGFSAAEVADLMEISAINQRVLLHRARSKVRQALELYFDEEATG
jgi:RNA polymerase sigma-70 factor (ECF subfamily)